MANSFELSGHIEEMNFLSDKLRMDQALEKIEPSSSGIFTIVNEASRPQGLVRDEYLAILGPAEKRVFGKVFVRQPHIGKVLKRLPGLITIDADVEYLSEDDLVMFGRLFYETQAPALVVLQDDKPIGTISRGTIMRAMTATVSPRLRTAPMREQFGYLPGAIAKLRRFAPHCSFICNKCDPPVLRRPRDCDIAPTCPREPDHGDMEAA